MSPDIRICVKCQHFWKDSYAESEEEGDDRIQFNCTLPPYNIYMGFYTNPKSPLVYIRDKFSVPDTCPYRLEHAITRGDIQTDEAGNKSLPALPTL